jgi:uncharacterized membrane protein
MADGAKKKGLFASIDNGAEAAKLVREASYGFLALAALQALVGMFLLPALLTDAVVLAILAGALMKWRSRIAAVLLLLVSGVEAGVTVLNRLGVMHQGGRNIFLAAIMLIVAVRAVEATFKLHGRYRGQLAAAA